MPSLPEFTHTARLIGRIEIGGKTEAKQQSYPNGHIRIAREVRIDLNGISEQGHHILKSGVHGWIGEYAVHKVQSEVIGQQYFFEQSVENPKKPKSELLPGEPVGLTQLRNEIRCPHNGACHQLREKGNIEAKVEDAFHWLDVSAVDVHRIADGLER